MLDKPTYLPNPCTQDCPDRHGGCAIDCEKYKAYVQDRTRRYEEQAREREKKRYNEAETRRKQEHIAQKKEGRVHYGIK